MLIPPLLRESRMFRRFWLGQTVSLVGDQVSLIALPLVAVLVLDADAAQMGYLVAAELLPNLLFSLHAGAWADRRARKRQTMVATDLALWCPLINEGSQFVSERVGNYQYSVSYSMLLDQAWVQ